MLMLLTVAIVNALRYTTKKRVYSLYTRSERLNSPSVRYRKYTRKELSANEGSISFRKRFWTWFLEEIVGYQPNISGHEDEDVILVQQLHIWDPDEFTLHLFRLYSPPVPILYFLLEQGNVFIVMFAIAIISFLTSSLIKLYDQQAKDKLLVHTEVLQEYNDRFVYPHVFPVKRDAQTQTETTNAFEIPEPEEGVHPSPFLSLLGSSNGLSSLEGSGGGGRRSYSPARTAGLGTGGKKGRQSMY
ncbi:hypothetical protein BT69DRAFT_1278021 [Atractiella rhizophila]|nr:hypothetical protein BT69DRAFT_1278021 [Atractiella rhizophila]